MMLQMMLDDVMSYAMMSDFINDVPDMSSLLQGETKGLMENTEAL